MHLNKILPALLLSLAFSANAETPLTQADLLGTWSVDKESLSRDADTDVSKELNTQWTFKQDGTIIGESTDNNTHARVGKLRAVVKYRIEDGKMVKQSRPGRSKENTCVAVEREGAKLVLKCDNIYFFLTKK